MVICFKCDSDTKRLLDSLVGAGGYADYAEVISLAVGNLAVMHTEVGRTGAMVLGESTEPPGHHLSEVSPSASVSEAGKPRPGRPAGRGRVANAEALPSLFGLEGLTSRPGNLPAPPSAQAQGGVAVPVDAWIFGQYNKMLPVKATCRALAHLAGGSEAIPLAEAAQQIAQEAALLGDILRSRDVASDANRDNALATAFPMAGPKGEKGRLRYMEQFVGSHNRDRRLSGLPAALRLVVSLQSGEGQVRLTQAGWELAAMRNPIIDDGRDASGPRFSEAEANYLVEHIGAHVPQEAFAYCAVLAAIADGHNAPESLDEALSLRVGPQRRGEAKRSYLASQRSGAISRMVDLCLVTRVRHGVRMLYEPTAMGLGFLQGCGRE